MGGGDWGEDDVFDFERDFANTAHGVVDATAKAVNDVVIGFEAAPFHSDGIEHTLATIDVVVTDDGVNKDIIRWHLDVARHVFGFGKIIVGDFILLFSNADASPIIKTLDVRTGDGHHDTADHDIGALFGSNECIVQTGLRGIEIYDFTFADASRGRLADAEYLHRAIRPDFGDDDADFGGADFKADVNVGFRH